VVLVILLPSSLWRVVNGIRIGLLNVVGQPRHSLTLCGTFSKPSRRNIVAVVFFILGTGAVMSETRPFLPNDIAIAASAAIIQDIIGRAGHTLWRQGGT